MMIFATIVSIVMMTLAIIFDNMFVGALGIGIVVFLWIFSKDFRKMF